MSTIKERVRQAEIKIAKNRFGLDMSYFHQWFERSLTHLNDYKPTELARELARMSRTADSSVMYEKEFQSEQLKQLQSSNDELRKENNRLRAKLRNFGFATKNIKRRE